jgi:hypothetical protein
MSSKLPQALLEKQELERQLTVNKVLRAIQDLEAEGCQVNIKNLLAYSGLSRSVFAKAHIRAVLVDRVPTLAAKPLRSQKGSNKNKKSYKIQKYEERIQRLMTENDDLKRECELLRGRLFLLMQRQQEN